jgi:hypothetical protein
MKFEKKKISALTGNTEVHFSEESSEFKIIADKTGIRLQGSSPTFYDITELNIFAKAVGDAWNNHIKLKPDLMASLNGH